MPRFFSVAWRASHSRAVFIPGSTAQSYPLSYSREAWRHGDIYGSLPSTLGKIPCARTRRHGHGARCAARCAHACTTHTAHTLAARMRTTRRGCAWRGMAPAITAARVTSGCDIFVAVHSMRKHAWRTTARTYACRATRNLLGTCTRNLIHTPGARGLRLAPPPPAHRRTRLR